MPPNKVTLQNMSEELIRSALQSITEKSCRKRTRNKDTLPHQEQSDHETDIYTDIVNAALYGCWVYSSEPPLHPCKHSNCQRHTEQAIDQPSLSNTHRGFERQIPQVEVQAGPERDLLVEGDIISYETRSLL